MSLLRLSEEVTHSHFSDNNKNPFLSKKSFFSKGHVSPVNKMKNKGGGHYFLVTESHIGVLPFEHSFDREGYQTAMFQSRFPSFHFWSHLCVIELVSLNKNNSSIGEGRKVRICHLW